MRVTEQTVDTRPFHPFGKTGSSLLVPGTVKANGTILRSNLDGSGLEVYAWGLRNPFGVMWSPAGTLYATENGCDVRGSRPIANDEEDIYIVKKDAWYGWPDYAMGQPVTNSRFKPKDKPQPQFLMAEHPPVEQPWLNFPKHSAIAKLDFASSEAFGRGQMFVAFFGHMAPMTGEAPEEHGGAKGRSVLCSEAWARAGATAREGARPRQRATRELVRRVLQRWSAPTTRRAIFSERQRALRR
jgi:hypothetical protein